MKSVYCLYGLVEHATISTAGRWQGFLTHFVPSVQPSRILITSMRQVWHAYSVGPRGVCLPPGDSQTHPPEIDKDITALMEKGVPVYVVNEDAVERGLVAEELVSGVQHVSRSMLPKLLDQFDHIWHW
jgi:hypothetical protein